MRLILIECIPDESYLILKETIFIKWQKIEREEEKMHFNDTEMDVDSAAVLFEKLLTRSFEGQ